MSFTNLDFRPRCIVVLAQHLCTTCSYTSSVAYGVPVCRIMLCGAQTAVCAVRSRCQAPSRSLYPTISTASAPFAPLRQSGHTTRRQHPRMLVTSCRRSGVGNQDEMKAAAAYCRSRHTWSPHFHARRRSIATERVCMIQRWTQAPSARRKEERCNQCEYLESYHAKTQGWEPKNCRERHDQRKVLPFLL